MSPLVLLVALTHTASAQSACSDVDARLATVEDQLDQILGAVERLSDQATGISADVQRTDSHLSQMWTDVDKQFGAMKDRVDTRFKDLSGQVYAVGQGVALVDTGLSAHASTVDAELVGIAADTMATSRAVREVGARFDAVDAALADQASAAVTLQDSVDAIPRGEAVRLAFTSVQLTSQVPSRGVWVECDQPYELLDIYAAWDRGGQPFYGHLVVEDMFVDPTQRAGRHDYRTDVLDAFDLTTLSAGAHRAISFDVGRHDGETAVAEISFVIRTGDDAICTTN